ncbi:MAG: hypothetical protein RIB30_15895 [Thalassospira sp.]|uniref:GTP pyrophosphokinase n=1 Tax=Thalassospira sp. TaxID=1912094 RepID=UPI0032ED1D7F
MSIKKVQDALNDKLVDFERLTFSTEWLLKKILSENEVEYLSVAGRTKSNTSISEKIKRKSYSNPLVQMTDITGIRIIVYLESHIPKVCQIIRETFDIDEKNSIDRDRVLGSDRIGYRSVHFVCSLGGRRKDLPEYARIHDLKFEIQVRTVFQHAWAELAHERAYKFSGKLPPHLERQLNLYSGMLESVDKGFDTVASEVDQYSYDLSIESTDRFDDRSIDSIVISKFMSRLIEENELEIDNVDVDSRMVEELKLFGINKVHDLYHICNQMFIDAYLDRSFGYQNTYGFLRDSMMYYDIEKYFQKPWALTGWSGTTEESLRLLATKYGPDVREFFDDREMDILEEDEYMVI